MYRFSNQYFGNRTLEEDVIYSSLCRHGFERVENKRSGEIVTNPVKVGVSGRKVGASQHELKIDSMFLN